MTAATVEPMSRVPSIQLTAVRAILSDNKKIGKLINYNSIKWLYIVLQNIFGERVSVGLIPITDSIGVESIILEGGHFCKCCWGDLWI